MAKTCDHSKQWNTCGALTHPPYDEKVWIKSPNFNEGSLAIGTYVGKIGKRGYACFRTDYGVIVKYPKKTMWAHLRIWQPPKPEMKVSLKFKKNSELKSDF